MSFCRVSPQGAGPPRLYTRVYVHAPGASTRQSDALPPPSAPCGVGATSSPPRGRRRRGAPPAGFAPKPRSPAPSVRRRPARPSAAPGDGVQRGRREPRGENIVKNKTKTNRSVPRRQRPPRCPSCCRACSATSCRLPSPAMAPTQSPGEEEAVAGGPSPCSPSGAHLGPRFVLCLISFSVLAAPTSWPINIYIYLYPK